MAGTLVLASVGSFLLIRRDTVVGAQRQLRTQTRTVALHPEALYLRRSAARRPRLCCVELLRVLGGYTSLSVATASGGTLSGDVPAPLQGLHPSIARLREGRTITGHVGERVFVLAPLDLTAPQRARLVPPISARGLPVLVATRQVSAPAGGLGYFLVVGLAVLAIATAVAYWLASRFSAPVRRAVRVTGRIASGDLKARLPTDPAGPPELTALAEAINAMGDRLGEAREQQRQFLLSISHELRTPLTSIVGYAQAISEGATEDVPSAVQVIASEAGRLEHLVQDLLDLARLDARRFSFHPAPSDLAHLLAETVESFRPAADRASLALHLDLPDGGPLELVTDALRVRQLLSNLVENAFRYARSGVWVGGRPEGQGATLWVSDDGPGIAPEDLPRVFDRHFSSHAAGALASGTGLGLAIVAELVTAMGGQVEAASPLDAHGGTRMVVRLPPLEVPDPGRPAAVV